MTRFAFSILLLLGCLSVARGDAPRKADSSEQPPLRWGADSEGGAPYICKDPKHPNGYVGFEVDLKTALEKELGRRIQFVQYDFKNLVAGLKRGDIDFAMNGVEVTPDRIRALRLSRPYYAYTLQLVARANESRFDSLKSCKRLGGVVGTLEDTAAERLLDKLGVKKRVYGNQVEPYLDLKLGRIDAVFLDWPIATYIAKPMPELKFVGLAQNPGYYAIAFRKDQEALATQFDAALERLAKNGELQRIYEKWGIWNDDQQRLLDKKSAEQFFREASEEWSFARYFPLLLDGAVVTVVLTFLSMFVAMLLGLPIALMRLYGPPPLRLAAMVYVEFFRGIPVLLLLFFLYYGLPVIAETYNLPIDLKLGPMAAAILGFGLNYAAYQAEIYRAGIASIPIGQWEAGASLGMSRLHVFHRIILPQAVRVILPPTTNDLVALFKDTSIVSIIAIEELTKEYQILAKSSLKYLEIGFVTAMLYLIMSVPLGYLSRYLERRWGKGR
ncbi:MAG: ABC transporter substrate-binding protein/permease [Thermoguttaceae bacterium]|jgi:polar amino acid transport system substrate-binding protein